MIFIERLKRAVPTGTARFLDDYDVIQKGDYIRQVYGASTSHWLLIDPDGSIDCWIGRSYGELVHRYGGKYEVVRIEDD